VSKSKAASKAKIPAKTVAKPAAKSSAKTAAKPSPKAAVKPAAKPPVKVAAKVAAKVIAKAAPKAIAKPAAKTATKSPVKAPAKAAPKVLPKAVAKPAGKPSKKTKKAAGALNDPDMADIEAELEAEPVAVAPGEKVKPLRMKISQAKARALMKEFGLEQTSLSEEEKVKRESAFIEMVKLGRTRGYLTHGEISDHLPGKLVEAEILEVVIAQLNDMGIAVYEQTPDAETLLINNNVATAATELTQSQAWQGALVHKEPPPWVSDGFVLRGGGTCGHTLPELSHAQKTAAGRTAHPPNHPHAPTCAHAARSAATFITIALLPAMGARVVFIVNRGWHTNP
jgi:RNA polymerase primary sigma factor